MLESIAPFFSLKQTALAIDILNLDYDLGNALGISEFAGGILLILVMTFAFASLPLWKKQYSVALIIAILTLSFGVAVAWLSLFVIVVIVMLIAVGIADKFTNVFSGLRS